MRMFSFALTVALILAAPTAAQQRMERAAPSTAPASFTAATQQQTIDSVAALLERMYPAADTGVLIADHLRERFAAGAFASATEPAAFVSALTREMQAVNGDRHLNVRLAGTGPGRRARPSPESEREANYYLSRPEVLEGNVGYLKVGMLSRHPEALEVLGASLRELEHTDAIIIDLRGTPGGSPMMANGIISHFTEPGIPSLRVSDRYMNETYVRETLDQVPGPRRTDVPLYVLVDSRSASAAEDVPFVLQNLGRATIVGERTAGAGRNNVLEDVGNGVIASISVSRVQDPATGREWELVGVQPDIAVPAAQALETARAHAVRQRSAT